MEKLNDLVSLENQVIFSRLQDKLGKEDFHEDQKNQVNQLLKQMRMPPKS